MKQKATDLSKKPDILCSIENNSVYEDRSFSGIIAQEGLKIVGTEFSGCTFNSCKLFKISFYNCTFEDCAFENCDVASASIKHTSFRRVKFIDTKITGIQWPDAAMPLDVNFTRCLLNYAGFIGVDLRNTAMIECQLKEADFSEANLTKADCSFSDFSGARFSNTNLTRANFTNATNYAIHPHGNTLCKTRFSSPEVLSLLDLFDIIIE
ncbi:pentapeptide repeat-containing protein [Desulfocastanea catecholica]